MRISGTIILALVLTCASRGHAYWNAPNQRLQPVQGLYVKPSPDGTTGDLYVAASENNGATQWLTDQPVSFLNAVASQPKVSYASSVTKTNSPHGETVQVQSNNRAVLNAPPVTYPYALPAIAPGDHAMPHPYAIPVSSAKTPETLTASLPHYFPFHYFYPHFTSMAFPNPLKEAGITDDQSNSISAPASAGWPATYPYPFQYVMVDPATWAASQAAVTPPSNVPASSASEEIDNSK